MTEMERYIREYAASIGLDPNVVMKTVLAEGGRSSLEPAGYARQSNLNFKGRQEQSYGPFQMFMGGGLGNRALQAGFDPRDPAQAFNVAKFAMDTMSKEGLGAWHGWKGDPWAAHGYTPSGQKVAQPDASAYAMMADGPKGEEMYPTPAPALPAPYDVADKPIFDMNAGTQVAEAKPKTLGGRIGKNIGKAVTSAGSIVGGGGGGSRHASLPQSPQAARLDAPGEQPTINPQMADQQRQMLAMALARLNAGRLVV